MTAMRQILLIEDDTDLAGLLDRVFDDAESETVVDTYVHYCRRKLGRGVISTVRGLGYRLGSS